MYKLYGKDGSEKNVETSTDRNEHINSGFYSETKCKGLVPEIKEEPVKKESVSFVDYKKENSKPKKRKGI